MKQLFSVLDWLTYKVALLEGSVGTCFLPGDIKIWATGSNPTREQFFYWVKFPGLGEGTLKFGNG